MKKTLLSFFVLLVMNFFSVLHGDDIKVYLEWGEPTPSFTFCTFFPDGGKEEIITEEKSFLVPCLLEFAKLQHVEAPNIDRLVSVQIELQQGFKPLGIYQDVFTILNQIMVDRDLDPESQYLRLRQLLPDILQQINQIIKKLVFTKDKDNEGNVICISISRNE